MLGELPGQPEQVPGHGAGRLVQVEIGLPGGRDPVRKLPGTGLGEQPGSRVDWQPQPVLGDEAPGVGVVGEYGRLAGQHQRAPLRVEHVRTGQATQPGADPLGELLRRLAGEGQAEHRLGGDMPVRDQPHHPRRHRLRLARSGARDYQGRLGRVGGDHLGLLRGGWVHAQRVRELDRCDPLRENRCHGETLERGTDSRSVTTVAGQTEVSRGLTKPDS